MQDATTQLAVRRPIVWSLLADDLLISRLITYLQTAGRKAGIGEIRRTSVEYALVMSKYSFVKTARDRAEDHCLDTLETTTRAACG